MATKLTETKAEQEATKTIEEIMEEYVEYEAPMTANPDERDILVAVNGETLRIKRGERVQIKRKFLEVLRQADEQRRSAIRYQREQQHAAAQAVAKM